MTTHGSANKEVYPQGRGFARKSAAWQAFVAATIPTDDASDVAHAFRGLRRDRDMLTPAGELTPGQRRQVRPRRYHASYMVDDGGRSGVGVVSVEAVYDRTEALARQWADQGIDLGGSCRPSRAVADRDSVYVRGGTNGLRGRAWTGPMAIAVYEALGHGMTGHGVGRSQRRRDQREEREGTRWLKEHESKPVTTGGASG